MVREIYLDYAASTPVDKQVQREIQRAFLLFGNPSSLNTAGRKAKKALEISRSKIAKIIGAKDKEIVFTNSGSESNNLAIVGAALANKGKHIVTSNIEHKSVLEPIKYLVKERGYKATHVKADKKGFIKPEDVAKAVKKDTILVSVMHANNEVGTIEPIRKIIRLVKKKNPNVLFHTDVCQTTGYLTIKANEMDIDLMTFNSSKVYGPKGVAALFIKTGINIEPQIRGGEQEMGLKAGTENVAGVVGFAKAMEIASKKKGKEVKRLVKLRDYFANKILEVSPDAKINGHKDRLPNFVNVSFLGVDSEFLVLNLDRSGIYASSGSACQVHGPSHVLKALGIEEKKWGTVRFSLGRSTSKDDVDLVIKKLPIILRKSGIR
jgi:cysteine desulfurase